MPHTKTMRDLLREHKTLLIVMVIGVILLEVEIFAFAAMKAGRKSVLEIRDQRGSLIHVTDGNNLSTFNKYYFEQTFGPIDRYRTRLVLRENPFPFRAWFAAAVGIPVGAVLLFGFIIRAYLAIVYGDNLTREVRLSGPDSSASQTRLQKMVSRANRINIFVIGVVVFLMAAGYWIIPNMVSYLGKAGLDTAIRYKWIFLPMAVILIVIVVWIIYLRYLLAKQAIQSQAEVSKYQLALTMQKTDPRPVLECTPLHPESFKNVRENNDTQQWVDGQVMDGNTHPVQSNTETPV
jgi:hypothetical protein